MNIGKTLLQNIKILCQQKGITMKDLELELKFPLASMRKWEQSKPSIEKVAQVAKFFNISIDSLISENMIDNHVEFASEISHSIKIIEEMLLDLSEKDIKKITPLVKTAIQTLINDKN